MGGELKLLNHAVAPACIGKYRHSDQSKTQEQPGGGLGNGSGGEVDRPTAADTAAIYSGVIDDVKGPRAVWISSIKYRERTRTGESGRRRRRKDIARPDIGGLKCAGNQRTVIRQGKQGGIVQCNGDGTRRDTSPDIGKDCGRLALRADQKHIDVVREGVGDSGESDSQFDDAAQSRDHNVGRIWCCRGVIVNRDRRWVEESLREEGRCRRQEHQRQQGEARVKSDFHRDVVVKLETDRSNGSKQNLTGKI
jgi:hypothetical protein